MKKNNYLIPVLLLLITGTSCERNLLKPLPQTVVVDASAFTTAGRIQSQVLSLYGAMKSGSWMGGRYVIAGDVKADNFINETNNLITDLDVWNGNPSNSSTAIINEWTAAYLAINNANNFIDGMNKTGTAVVGSTLGANYIAEAKVVRALSYYGLLQYWGLPYANGNGSHLGVPLRLAGIKSAGSSLLARSSVADVYKQIIIDLDSAEAGLPLNYTGTTAPTLNATRAHRNTAVALKTRVYLTMGQYDKVISEANKIVNATAPFSATTGVGNTLQSDITKVFGAAAITPESILTLAMSITSGDNPGTQNSLASYFSPAKIGVGAGEFSLNPAGVIADPNWKSADRRKAFILTNAGKSWLIKFNQPNPYTDYVPVIRYSEVMLNLAEARARSTNSIDAQAVALLNAVRNRSDSTTTFTAGSFASSTALINAIIQERNIEFLGEGLRNNDFVRLQNTIPTKGSAPAKGPTDQGYIWPISATELSLNTLCTDN
jgi:starch-binding outer membrane protein, SusD/RagB family